jgi:WD40 repeat protein
MEAAAGGVVASVDDAVVEYLAFRGLVESCRAMVRERAVARRAGLTSADRLAQELVDAAVQGPLARVLELWAVLEERGALRGVGQQLSTAAQRLKSSLLKLYLVRSKLGGRQEQVVEFFSAQVPEALRLDPEEWRPWCALAFCAAPARDPLFAAAAKPEWQRLLAVSLANLVAQALRARPAPRLLALPLVHGAEAALRAELRAKELECDAARLDAERSRHALAALRLSLEALPGAAEPAAPAPAPLAAEPRQAAEEEPGQPPSFGAGRHGAKVTRCRVSPDGQLLATSSNDATVRLWSLARAREAASAAASEVASEAADARAPAAAAAHSLALDQLVFCPSAALSLDWHSERGELLAIGTASASVRLWDVSARADKGSLLVTGDHKLPFVTDVRFCARRQLLATVSAGRSRGVGRGSEGASGTAGEGPEGGASAVQLRSLVCLWSASTLQLVRALEAEERLVHSVVFNHNGSLLLAGGSDGMVRVFDVLKSTTGPIMQWRATGGAATRLCLTSDETAVVALAADGSVATWSLHRLSEAVCAFPAPAETAPAPWAPIDLVRHGDLALNPDRPTQVVACAPALGAVVHVFDVARGARVRRLRSGLQPLSSLDWSGALLCTGSLDRSVRVLAGTAPAAPPALP